MDRSESRIIGNLEWDGLEKPRLYVAMTALLCGLFFSVLDGTVCNVALPTIAQELGIEASDSIWIVNAFQLVIVVLLLPFAALGELTSYRRVYMLGLLLFTSGSLLCALSPTFHTLVGARIIQGIGAALVMSVSTSLIKLIYPRKDLGKGIGLNATVVALALVIGPSFTGGILSIAGWPWLFIINIPFGVAAFLIARKSLPDNPTKVAGRRFDFQEALLNVLVFGLFIGCFEAFSHNADTRLVTAGLVLAAATAVAYVRNQQKKEFPMLPLDLLHIPVFSLSILTSIASFASQMTAMVAMPFLLTHNFGYDAARTGLLMTSYPVVILFTAPLSGYLIGKADPRLLSSIGLLVLLAGSLLLACLPAETGFWGIAWRFAVCGLGFGFFQSPNNHLILGSAPAHRAGSASGMLALARLVGQTLGAAAVAFFFHISGEAGPVEALLFGSVLSLAGMVFSFIQYFRDR